MIVKFEIRMIPKEKIRMSRQLRNTPRQKPGRTAETMRAFQLDFPLCL